MSGRIRYQSVGGPQSSKEDREGRTDVGKSVSNGLIDALRRMRNHRLWKPRNSHGSQRKEADLGPSRVSLPPAAWK